MRQKNIGMSVIIPVKNAMLMAQKIVKNVKNAKIITILIIILKIKYLIIAD